VKACHFSEEFHLKLFVIAASQVAYLSSRVMTRCVSFPL
jgi:hypothetical protein